MCFITDREPTSEELLAMDSADSGEPNSDPDSDFGGDYDFPEDYITVPTPSGDGVVVLDVVPISEEELDDGDWLFDADDEFWLDGEDDDLWSDRVYDR